MTTDEERQERQLKAIMTTEDGRAWVWSHLGSCGVFRSSYAADPYGTAYNEGGRNVGLKLLADLQHFAFGDYQKMESEARARLMTEVAENDT